MAAKIFRFLRYLIFTYTLSKILQNTETKLNPVFRQPIVEVTYWMWSFVY